MNHKRKNKCHSSKSRGYEKDIGLFHQNLVMSITFDLSQQAEQDLNRRLKPFDETFAG